MFNNVGKTIQGLAKVLFGVDIGLSILGWMILLILGLSESIAFFVVLSMIVLICGIFIAWVSCILLFAFGKLVENSDIVVKTMKNKEEIIKDDVPFGSDF